MKHALLVSLSACLLLTHAGISRVDAAPPTERGVYELHVSPTVDFSDKQQTRMTPFRVGLGQYFNASTHAGGYIMFTKSKNDSYWGTSDVWGLGIFGETSMTWDYPALPYLGLSLGFMDGDDENDTAFVATLSPGVKGYLLETLALSVQLDWNFSNKPIYDFSRDFSFVDSVEGSGKKSSVTMSLAIRWLFF